MRSSHRSHRSRPRKRRRLKKVSLMLLTSSIVSLVAGVLLFLIALIKPQGRRHELTLLSLYVFGAGMIGLLSRRLLEWLRTRQRRSTSAPTNRLFTIRNDLHQPTLPPPVLAQQTDRQWHDEDHRRGRSSGFALLFVLVLLGLTAGLALQTHQLARGLLRREHAIRQQSELRVAATDAALAAIQHLAEPEDPYADHLDQRWAQPFVASTPAGIDVRVVLRDEHRFFNLNNLAIAPPPPARPPAQILQDLLTLSGDPAPVPRVEALRDWVDADQEGVWESAWYRQRQAPHPAANRPLIGWTELSRMHGFDSGTFPRGDLWNLSESDSEFHKSASIWPVQEHRLAPLNLNTAGRTALLALMGPNETPLVDTLLALRSATPIRDLNLAGVVVHSPQYRALQPYLATRSQWFRVMAEARRGEQIFRLAALVRREGGGTVTIEQWAL